MAKMLGRLSPVQFCHRACLSPGEIRGWKPRAKNQERRETRDDILAQQADWFDETMERLADASYAEKYGPQDNRYWATNRHMPGQDYAESPYFGGQA